MIVIISGTLLVLISLLAVALQRLYSALPARELKRLASRGDRLARVLYRPVAYGIALRVLLWGTASAALALGLLLTIPAVPSVAGFMLVVLVLAAGLIVIPSMQLSVHTAQFAAFFAPAVVWVLSHTHPVFTKIGNFINRYRDLTAHSRLFEKQDLQELLARQKEQIDNRITLEELELAEQALAFNDRHAADIALKHKDVLLINADDSIGPVLLDQLHQSGQSSFLVYKDNKENIIGSLAMHDAVSAKQGGRVFDLIRSDLTFVHEDFTLRQVLEAFRRTGQQVVVVVNSFEEFVGIITLDTLLQQLLRESPEPDVIHYESRSEIAAYKPGKEDTAKDPEQVPAADEETLPTSPEVTEVIE